MMTIAVYWDVKQQQNKAKNQSQPSIEISSMNLREPNMFLNSYLIMFHFLIFADWGIKFGKKNWILIRNLITYPGKKMLFCHIISLRWCRLSSQGRGISNLKN